MPTDNETGGDSQDVNQTVANQNQGVKTPPKRDPILSARDQMLAEMDEKILQQRGDDDETFFQTADPRALAMAAEMGRESRGEQVSSDSRAGRNAAAGEEAERISQDVTEATADDVATRQTRVDARGQDPLEDYIVREAGKAPMFKTLVDGRTVLVPLERARAQLQKHLAADIRLQQATDQKRTLDAREAQIRATEATLQARARQPAVQPMDDTTLEQESTELVRSLVSQPEAVAAKKMAETLKKIRAATPQIDLNALANQAASVARQTIAAEDHVTALGTGLTQFTEAYPDIAADPDLFALADRKTNAIASENPSWSPGQVMMEAGKQTRDWVAGISGKPAAKTPSVTQLNSRQQVKQNLRPMPQSRSVRPAAAQDTNVDQSPQDAMAEIRKSRGQAY